MIKNNLLVFAASTLALVGFNAHAACSNDGSPATIRAQAIAEAAAFSSSARLAYADYFQANGTVPGSNAIAGYQNPTDVASVSCWTRSVTINTDGVRVQVAATPGYPEGAIELRAQLSNFSVSSWLCSSPDIVEITGLAGCSYTGAVPRKGLTWGKQRRMFYLVLWCHRVTASQAQIRLTAAVTPIRVMRFALQHYLYCAWHRAFYPKAISHYKWPLLLRRKEHRSHR